MNVVVLTFKIACSIHQSTRRIKEENNPSTVILTKILSCLQSCELLET